MTNPCDAVWLKVAAIWSAAALASFQTAELQAQSSDGDMLSSFDVSQQLDLDLALAGGDLRGVGDDAVFDLRFRFEAEQVREGGQRWGIRAGVAANTGDGRRGFSQSFVTGPYVQAQSLTGLVTGWTAAPGLDAGSGRVELSQAELYLKTNWLEWKLGWGQTAAVEGRERALTAMRLTRANGPIADLVGGGLSHTGLSLSAPAARVLVETRRIVGLSAAASYTPDPLRCGVDICRPGQTQASLSPEVKDLFSFSANFDRRVPSSRVRWRAGIGIEVAEAQSMLAAFENPWIFTAEAARDHNGITLSASYLTSNDGLAGNRYGALAVSAAIERGDWLYSVEMARGRSDIFDVEGGSFAVGASRWLGDNTLLSFGILAHDAGGLGGVIETGLRF